MNYAERTGKSTKQTSEEVNHSMSRYSYPHTIENGAGGERLMFLRRVPGATGDRLEGENLVKPGAGPPMHVHHYQEEALTVVEGRIGYQRPGEPAQFAGPGETATFRAGEAHRFWNAGEEDLRCTAYNVEYFLGAMFDSQKRNDGARPNLLDAAFLTRRYRSEYGMVEIPAPVQRFVFPVMVLIGRLLGRYKKYADAPEPVRR
jgi:quercetin dioxygenase-like cupin family protein